MANAKIEKYQQDLVDNLLEQMDSNPDFLKVWSEIPFSPYNGKGLNLYNGINQANLSMHLVQTRSADPRYYTFKQIKDLDLKLKKGSKGVAVQYFNVMDKEIERNGKTKDVKIPFVRLTHAFNAKDIEGLEPYEKTEGFAALKDDRDLNTRLSEIIKNAGVEISHGGNRAFYLGGQSDAIMMPAPERFSSKEAYAATLLHELAHSTGHASRQSRDMGDKEDDRTGYAKEELRAELSSVFMCQRLGISYKLENDQTHLENSAAYLKGWKGLLTNDKAEFFKAASDANKITAFLVDGKSFDRTLNKTNNKQAITISGQESNQLSNKDFNDAIDIVWSDKFDSFQTLKKGAIYPASIALDAPLQNIIKQSANNINRNFISLGKTQGILKELGLPSLPLTMNYSKLFTIKKEHDLNPKILKKILKNVNDPTMVFKNKRKINAPNSFVLLTELEDTSSKPVIVTLHVDRKQGTMVVNRISSIYGRKISQIKSALERNELIYAHTQKSQLIMSRLQLPSSLLTDPNKIIFNESIKSNAKPTKAQTVKLSRKNKSKGRSR